MLYIIYPDLKSYSVKICILDKIILVRNNRHKWSEFIFGYSFPLLLTKIVFFIRNNRSLVIFVDR